jgi:hypothetical protein
VCRQQTSRLFGFVAAIQVRATDDKPLTRFRSAVRGYCAVHRDEVPGRFAADSAAEGEVLFIGEPPAELRPAEADHFLKAADHMATDDAERGGVNARIELEDGWPYRRAPTATVDSRTGRAHTSPTHRLGQLPSPGSVWTANPPE